ncbi:MAG: AraC family transcriptional regulator [Kiritimatiellia bacterium]
MSKYVYVLEIDLNMPQTLSKALYNRLLRSPVLKEVLENLHLLSGMDALFLDGLGNERMAFPRSTVQGVRHIIQRDPELRALCVRRRLAVLAGEDSMVPLGFSELMHPLTVEGEKVGYLLLFAARTTGDVSEGMQKEWSNLAKSGGQTTWKEWREAWRELPYLNSRSVQAWKGCLSRYGGDLMQQVNIPGVEPHPGKLPPLILQGCHYIGQHYRESLRLREVAGECGVSAEHFSRLFHQSTGLRFREYLAETRIHHACADLTDTDDRISEIAFRCGFSTLSRFNRSFRELTGVTPRDWRKRIRFQ